MTYSIRDVFFEATDEVQCSSYGDLNPDFVYDDIFMDFHSPYDYANGSEVPFLSAALSVNSDWDSPDHRTPNWISFS